MGKVNRKPVLIQREYMSLSWRAMKQREGDGSAERPVEPVGSEAQHIGFHLQQELFPVKKELMR